MPRVTCPNCGRERVIMEGKRKRCRKCGTPLTGRMAKPAAVQVDSTEETGDDKKTTTTKKKS